MIREYHGLPCTGPFHRVQWMGSPTRASIDEATRDGVSLIPTRSQASFLCGSAGSLRAADQRHRKSR